MQRRLFLSMALTAALVATLAGPAIAAGDYVSTTNAPSKAFASGAKVATLYGNEAGNDQANGWYGKGDIRQILVHRQVSNYFDLTEATEATLTVKCEIWMYNGSGQKRTKSFNFLIRDRTFAHKIKWGGKPECLKILSVFVRAFPGDLNGNHIVNSKVPYSRDFEDVAMAADALEYYRPWRPDHAPMRITIRHHK